MLLTLSRVYGSRDTEGRPCQHSLFLCLQVGARARVCVCVRVGSTSSDDTLSIPRKDLIPIATAATVASEWSR